MTALTPRQERLSVTLDIITRTLQDLGRPAAPANVLVHFEQRLPLGVGQEVQCIAHFTYAELAMRINTALYGRPQQRQVLEEAPGTEWSISDIATALTATAHLLAQPWYPARDGDLVHVAYARTDRTPMFGETYAVEAAAPSPVQTWALRLLHHTALDPAEAGCFATTDTVDPLVEIWAEAGHRAVTVVRNGVVVHNGPATGRGA